MNRKFLFQFLSQTIIISAIYALLIILGFSNLYFHSFLPNLLSVSFIFLTSGLILFFKLRDHEPIANRFLIMTMVQLISILSLELAYIYTNQTVELILHCLAFSLIQFLFQTFFLVRIQKK
jgi:hypothetical protein